MRASFKQAGSIGLILDRNDVDLPVGAWTEGSNIRFKHGVVKSGFGWSRSDFTTVADSIFQATFLKTVTGDTFVYAADTDADGIADAVLTYDGASETDRTGTTGPNLWDTTGAAATDAPIMAEFHGHAILTNGLNTPVSWDGAAATVTELLYKSGAEWSDTDGAGATYTARIIRPYRDFLIALDINEDGTRYPRMVHWSSLAEPNELPPSWDYSDPEEESGRTDLGATTGFIVDGLQLRDAFVVYKEDAIYTMQYVGGEFQFQLYPVSRSQGLFSANCVVEANGRHFCVGQRDLYWFDGQQTTSAAEGVVREYFFSRMDEERREQCFVIHNISDKEIWVCYPEIGSTYCDKALVLDYTTNLWSQRDIPSLLCAFLGTTMEAGVADWDDEETLDWDEETELDWIESTFAAVASTLYGGGSGAGIVTLDDTNQEEGTDQTKFVRRTEICLNPEGLDDWHMVKTLYPRGTGQAFNIKVGTQDIQDGPVTWHYEGTFTPGTDYKLDCRVTGRMHALEVGSTGNVAWEFSGLDVEFERVGRR